MLFFHIRETDRQTHKGREICTENNNELKLNVWGKKAVVNYLYDSLNCY